MGFHVLRSWLIVGLLQRDIKLMRMEITYVTTALAHSLGQSQQQQRNATFAVTQFLTVNNVIYMAFVKYAKQVSSLTISEIDVLLILPIVLMQKEKIIKLLIKIIMNARLVSKDLLLMLPKVHVQFLALNSTKVVQHVMQMLVKNAQMVGC